MLVQSAGERVSLRKMSDHSQKTAAPKQDFRDLSTSDKIIYSAGAGGLLGATLGTFNSIWKDVPVIKGNVQPFLSQTARTIGRYSATFALVSAAFAGTDAVAENIRHKRDAWNSALAGCAAGLSYGITCMIHSVTI